MIDRTAEGDIMIGFCHNGSVATCFMNSLLGAFAYDAGRPNQGLSRRLIEYHDAAGPYIHDNRARICTYFLDHTTYQWLWMLDNDMKFPEDALHRLLAVAEDQDLKILAGAYWNKYGPSNIYLSWLLMSEFGIKALPVLPETDEPVEVSAVGMGCTLIHRDALTAVRDFQRTNFPDDPWDTFGADLLRSDSDESVRMGEDVTFCLRARRVGFPAYGLPSLVLDHFKSIFMPHGQKAALHDPIGDAGGGANGSQVKGPISAAV